MRRLSGLAIAMALFFVFGGAPLAEAAIHGRHFAFITLGDSRVYVEEIWAEPEQRAVFDEDIGTEVDIYRSTSNDKDFYFVKYDKEDRVILFGEAVWPTYSVFKPDGGLGDAARLFNSFKSRVDVAVNMRGDKDITLLEETEGEFYAWELRGDPEDGVKSQLRGNVTLQGEVCLPEGKVYHTVQKVGEKVFYTFSARPYWKGESAVAAGDDGLSRTLPSGGVSMVGVGIGILLVLILLFVLLKKRRGRGSNIEKAD